MYHPALHRRHDAKLQAISDNLDRARTRDPNQGNARWVKAGSNVNAGRLAEWAAASGDARTALEERWAIEDEAEEDATTKAGAAEESRRRQVTENRARLRG
jgi:hypothetical protein